MTIDVNRFRRRLQELERELARRFGAEAETAREAGDDQGDAGDQARVGELKDHYFILANADAATLAEVRAALRRIDNGTFGRCVADGEPIEIARLESVPWAPYCLKHQREREER
jgi:RNA polymerase-binding transcription factor DksA